MASQTENVVNNNTDNKKDKKKMALWKKILIAILCICLAGAGIGYGIFNHYYNKMDHTSDELTEDNAIGKENGMIDTDGDGISDSESEILEFDMDGDGKPDTYAIWVDTDDDGVDDTLVQLVDLDGDGFPETPGNIMVDTDGDGVPDAFAAELEDSDGDGIADMLQEEFADDELNLDEATDEEKAAIEQAIRDNIEDIVNNNTSYNTGTFNFMLIGVDSRTSSFKGRSDSMILVTVDRNKKKITMTSFMRDIWCSIPGYGTNRLNASYSFGGTSLLAKTLKQNFGITVDKFICTNFHLVSEFIDYIGGVDVELSEKEAVKVFGSGKKAGTYHLDGPHALFFSRIRHLDSDFRRVERQRRVIMACINIAKKKSLSELNSILNTYLPKVRTTMPQSDFAFLLSVGATVKNYSISSMTIPVSGSWKYARIRGKSVITINFRKNAQAWYDFVK